MTDIKDKTTFSHNDIDSTAYFIELDERRAAFSNEKKDNLSLYYKDSQNKQIKLQLQNFIAEKPYMVSLIKNNVEH